MIACPYCAAENIDGSDVCAQCGQPLSDSHLSEPGSEVERGLLADRVRHLSPNTPIVVAPDMSIGEVLRLLIDRQIGCVFVVEGNSVVGVFSERDALRKIGVDVVAHADTPVSQFMTPNPQSLDANAKIAFAVRMMDLGGYRHIPVLGENGEATGVISIRDILDYLAGKMGSVAG